MTASMPSPRERARSLARSASYLARSAVRFISSELSSCACPYFNVPADWCARFHSRSAVNDFTGARSPSDASHALKSRFMPYLNTTEQSSSRPLASSGPLHTPHLSQLLAGLVVTIDGISAGSFTVAP